MSQSDYTDPSRWRSTGVLLGVVVLSILMTVVYCQNACPNGQHPANGTPTCNSTTPCPSGSQCNTASGICCTNCRMKAQARFARMRAFWQQRRQNRNQNRNQNDYVGELNFNDNPEEQQGNSTTTTEIPQLVPLLDNQALDGE